MFNLAANARCESRLAFLAETSLSFVSRTPFAIRLVAVCATLPIASRGRREAPASSKVALRRERIWRHGSEDRRAAARGPRGATEDGPAHVCAGGRGPSSSRHQLAT